MKKSKGLLSLALAFMLILGAFITTPIAVYANEIRVTINGEQVTFPYASPANVDGRTLVPVRAVFEALDFSVSWDIPTQTATLTRGNDEIIISIGNTTFTTNGISHNLDVPAAIIGGSTMVPIRLPLESVGYYVDWNGATNTVVISSMPIQGAGATQQTTAQGVMRANYLFPRQFHLARPFSEGLAQVRYGGRAFDDGLNGFVDRNGNTIIPYRYINAQAFSEGLAGVQFDEEQIGYRIIGTWGFIDETGNNAIAPRWNEVRPFSDGLAMVRMSDWSTGVDTGLWGIIDRTGNYVVPPKYNGIRDFSDGLAAVWAADTIVYRGSITSQNGRLGFIDRQGNEVIPLQSCRRACPLCRVES